MNLLKKSLAPIRSEPLTSVVTATDQTIACLKGHSEHANAMSFDGDHRLLSVAGDGCLFVWNIRRTANGAAEGSNNPAQAAGATNHDAALCLTPTDALAPSIALPSMPLNQADAVSVPQNDALVPQGDAMLVHDLIRQLHDNSSTKQGKLGISELIRSV